MLKLQQQQQIIQQDSLISLTYLLLSPLWENDCLIKTFLVGGKVAYFFLTGKSLIVNPGS
nr:MAG TPA: hypothetical protein [Caudoviricetes sp.]